MGPAVNVNSFPLVSASLYASPVIGPSGLVYLGAMDPQGTLFCVNVTSGTKVWTYATNPSGSQQPGLRDIPSWLSPTLSPDGSVVYVAADQSGTGAVFALNALTGAPVWTRTFLYTAMAVPVAVAGYVYIATYNDGGVFALNPSDGSTKWSNTNCASYIEHTSIAYGGDTGFVYVGTHETGIIALSAQGLGLGWAFPAGGFDYATSPAVGPDGTVFVGDNDYGGKLYALHQFNGTQKWAFTGCSGGFTGSPSVAGTGGVVYVGCYDKNLYAVNAFSGSLLWSFTTGSAIESAPVIGVDGTVYFGSDDGFFYALDSRGAPLWRFNLGGSVVSSAAMGADGTLYVGSSSGSLWTFQQPSPSPTPTPTHTMSTTPTVTPSSSSTASITPSSSSTASITPSSSSTASVTPSSSASRSETSSGSPTPSETFSGSPTPSETLSGSTTPSETFSGSPTPSEAFSGSPTPSVTGSSSLSQTQTGSATRTLSLSTSCSLGASHSRTPSPSLSSTRFV